MQDGPLLALSVTVWLYWFGVAIMALRAQLRWRKPSGLIPELPRERRLWCMWIPVIVAWNVLPAATMTSTSPLVRIPLALLDSSPYAVARAAALICAVGCTLVTVLCWIQMGKNWQIGAILSQPTELVTRGLFSQVRHPIYALGMLFMISSLVIVPTPPMACLALCYLILIRKKILDEEHAMLRMHGERYADYCRRTGRLFPWWFSNWKGVARRP